MPSTETSSEGLTKRAARVVPRKVVLGAALITGIVLVGIGLRFLFDPTTAATFFGVSRTSPGFALHQAVALRDIWLGLLAVAFALLRDWRSLALWLALGAIVCFGDAWIAASSSQRWVSVTFHLASGALCLALAVLCWSHACRVKASDRGA